VNIAVSKNKSKFEVLFGNDSDESDKGYEADQEVSEGSDSEASEGSGSEGDEGSQAGSEWQEGKDEEE
jgi:hypothetical protein